MEVLQVECVVPDLIPVLAKEGLRANLELDDEDRVVDQRNRIDALAQTGNDEFEIEPTASRNARQSMPEYFKFVQPSVALVLVRNSAMLAVK